MGRLRDGVVLRRWSGIVGALVLVSLLWGSGVAAPAATDAADLRGQWHLDEGAPGIGDDGVSGTPDSSGNGLTAVVRYTGQVPGRFGTAFRFDQSSWVFTTSALLRPQQLTVMAWVRADQSPGTLRYVLAQGAGGPGVCIPAAYGMYTSVAGDVNADGLSFYVTHAGVPYHAPGVPASKVWDGKWHMVVGTFDGSTAQFYFDGTKIGNGTAVPGAIDYSQPTNYFTIGAYGQPSNGSCAPTITTFKGDIDEVRIYSRALTASEMQTLAANTATSPPVVGDTPVPPMGPSDAPTTTITLDPAAPGAAGYYTNFVEVKVTATGGAPLETRCVLDPLTPTSFDDLPSGCKFTGGARISRLGIHAVYAASRDGSGMTTPMASRTFRLSEVPQTTIASGPSGLTWRPDNFFYFTSDVNPAQFQCRMDDSAFKSCSNPYETGTLSQTDHIFAVRAIAPGGAVDPTPARRRFKQVAAPLDVQTSCESNIGYPLQGKNGCFIGTLGRHGCAGFFVAAARGVLRQISTGGSALPRGLETWLRMRVELALNVDCVVRQQPCPVGARCTITTKSSWFDVDRDIAWGSNAAAGLGNLERAVFLREMGAPSKSCLTSGTHRCAVTTTLQMLGGGRPLWSLCVGNIRHILYDYRTRLGDNTARRIHCEADWHVGPASELAALPADPFGPAGRVGLAGQVVQVSTFSPGLLSALFTIPGQSTGPQITPVRKAVSRAGTLTIPLKLNKAAKQLLKQKKTLTISLRLNFTRKGGRRVTRTQRVTITAPRNCPAQQPKPGAKLPACLPGQ